MTDSSKEVTSLDRKTEDDPKVTNIECKVPRGVLVPGDEGDRRKALNIVTLRELTGHEEDILANDRVNITTRLNRIIGRSIVSVSDGEKVISDRKSLGQMMSTHPWGFSLGDSLTLLFRIREVTVGDEYRQKVVCPDCTDEDGEPFSWTHVGSLSDLEILRCEGDPSEYEREFTTSRGNVVRWQMLTAAREEEYSRKRLSKDKATLSLLMRVVAINGNAVTKALLKDMPLRERAEVRERFDEEGGIDTNLEMTCANCGHEFKVPLDISARDFFNHSGTSKT